MTRASIAWLVAVAVGCPAAATAATHSITATVVDRNGQGLGRTRVLLTPKDDDEQRSVELVTDRAGAFLVDYLRDGAGERTKLAKKCEYSIEVYKPGYHVYQSSFSFRRGELTLDAIVLVEETIEVEDLPEDIAPSIDPEQTHAAGATYEGQ